MSLHKSSRWLAGAALIMGLTAGTSVSAADEHGHGDEHGASHENNWLYGLLGEGAEGEEPTLLFRSPGMPVPLLANHINSAILFTLPFKFGKEPVMNGLAKRREDIMRSMQEADAMRKEALAQLEVHQAKLEKIEAEVTRIRTEMREAAEAERTHILAEAKKRRERMERDAKQMIAHELKNAKEQL